MRSAVLSHFIWVVEIGGLFYHHLWSGSSFIFQEKADCYCHSFEFQEKADCYCPSFEFQEKASYSYCHSWCYISFEFQGKAGYSTVTPSLQTQTTSASSGWSKGNWWKDKWKETFLLERSQVSERTMGGIGRTTDGKSGERHLTVEWKNNGWKDNWWKDNWWKDRWVMGRTGRTTDGRTSGKGHLYRKDHRWVKEK